MKMKRQILWIAAFFLMNSISIFAQGVFHGNIYLKTPGGSVVDTYPVSFSPDGNVIVEYAEGVSLAGKIINEPAGTKKIDLNITADKTRYFNLELEYESSSKRHEECEFYLPGFWYHKNERSPENAPSFRLSDSWQVREDRLSSPLAGVYDTQNGKYMTVVRNLDGDRGDCMIQNLSGDIILPGHTSIGYTGFGNNNGKSTLTFGYPYKEAPKRYIRKLTLINPVRAFEKIDKGEDIHLSWTVLEGSAADYSDFIAATWNYSYDTFTPQPLADAMDVTEAKKYLTAYFDKSYVDKFDIKYFSGEGLRTDDCKSMGGYQVGFVGRVLLNAFNAIEYGEENNRPDLVEKGNNILSSVLEHGFTPEGYFIEACNFDNNTDCGFLSIRRQSEGVFAILNWLDYERKKGVQHPEWDRKMKTMLDKMLELQNPDGSFPRKFDGAHRQLDGTGGSTPSATLPLVMGYKYFKDKRYLQAAKRTADYLEKEIINKSDYFSSTLDANCEDKEAALYASTAMYYLSLVTKGNEKAHYMDMCKKAAYFCLTWYYLWDVPFSQGQMLGDVGFKSRGWGNVSVENNHIDVFIFEFASILDHLGKYYNEPRFNDFSSVIKTSMLQLMPKTDHSFDIAKTGYYPEVVQHTTWDYGKNGKGFYNDIFAPGWTVASLWQMLSPERVDKFFN